MSSEVLQNPELLNGTDIELMQGLIQRNYSLPNTSILLEQLDTIDNAACGWTRFMSKVSIREAKILVCTLDLILEKYECKLKSN